MKSKYALTLRPKYALWILVALLGSTWYIADPQAKSGPAAVRGTPSAAALLSIRPAHNPGQSLIAGTKS